MRNVFIIFLTILTVSCGYQKNDNSKTNSDEKKAEKSLTYDKNVIDQKSVVLYLPDSIELLTLEKEKSEEELNSIEYDKTMAVQFLDSMKIKYFVENKRIYLFKLTTEKIDTIDKKSFQNWGAILFTPSKSPKVVFLNEIETEYKKYFE